MNNPPSDADKASVGRAESAARPPFEAGAPVREGPRQLHRDLGDDAAHRAKLHALDEEIARAENHPGSASEEETAAPPARAAASPPVAETREPEARATAGKFFAALAAGDTAAMAGLAEIPFRTTGGGTVKTRGELLPMLKDLATEGGHKGLRGVQVLTGAGVRAALGKLPPGLDDGSGLLFAVSSLRDGDVLIAALAKRGVSYRVVALVRR